MSSIDFLTLLSMPQNSIFFTHNVFDISYKAATLKISNLYVADSAIVTSTRLGKMLELMGKITFPTVASQPNYLSVNDILLPSFRIKINNEKESCCIFTKICNRIEVMQVIELFNCLGAIAKKVLLP